MFGLQNEIEKKSGDSEKTLREIYELWKPIKKELVKASTLATYVIQMELYILPFFGDDTTITEEKVQAFVFDRLKSGLSLKTVKDIVLTLKMILHFAEKKRWTKNSTGWDIRYPKDMKARKLDVLSKANHKRLLDYVSNNFTFENLGLLIVLCSGMRIGEICALKWEDIDMENRVIHVNKTIERYYIIDDDGRRYTKLEIGDPKTINSVREIPIGTPLMKVVRPLKKVTNDEYFVLTNSLSPTEPRTYRNHFHDLLDQLGIPRIRFHGLRHTFATRCIESKCDYKTVSEILGHANIGTTLNLYVHPNIEQKQHCVEQMFKSIR